MTALNRLDSYYADQLGCFQAELNAGGLVVVPNRRVARILFAKGVPLAVYAIARGSGAVIAARPELAAVVQQVILKTGARVLDESLWSDIREKVYPLVRARSWFSGIRLYCSPDSFNDCCFGEVGLTTAADEHSIFLHRKWGGEVFGQMVDGKVVSWAAVKPLSDTVWDLSIETHANYRGQGYAKSAVSAALKHIFENGRLAGWGTDTTNTGSLRTAAAVGFIEYAHDFGCIEEI